MTSAQHSSASNEHYTPLEYIEAARRTMGQIDLDPATTARVNELRVKAPFFCTKEDNGLEKPWSISGEPSRVWLNPPGGVVENTRQSNAAVWWKKLVDEWLSNNVEQAVFLGFSIEILATSQDADMWCGGFPFCIPRTRIPFETEAEPGVFKKGASPTHSNVIVYIPPLDPKVDGDCDRAAVARFEKEFSRFGKVRIS